MTSRLVRILLSGCLLAPVAATVTAVAPAGAAPPPAVSATSGVPGTQIDVTLADCVTDFDEEVFEFMQVLRCLIDAEDGSIRARQCA